MFHSGRSGLGAVSHSDMEKFPPSETDIIIIMPQNRRSHSGTMLIHTPTPLPL